MTVRKATICPNNGVFIVKTTMRKFYTLLISFAVAASLQAQSSSFFKVIGNHIDDELRAVKELPDGTILVAGVSRSHSPSHFDLLLMKMNTNGSILWSKIYRSTTSTMDIMIGKNIATAWDGSIFITGDIITNIGQRIFLVKTDASGNLLWCKLIEGAIALEGFDVAISGNDLYLAANQVNFANNTGIVVKLDLNGNLIWSKQYYDPTVITNSTDFRALTITTDGLAIAGNFQSSFSPDNLTIKIDTSGNILWSRTISSGGIFETFHDIESNNTGHIYSVGQIETAINGAVIVKYDLNGNRQFFRLIQGSGNTATISWQSVAINDTLITGTLLVQDYDDPNPWAPDNAYIVQLGTSGQAIWSKKFLLEYMDQPYSLTTTSDGNYITSGFVTGINGKNSYVAKGKSTVQGQCPEESAALTADDFGNNFPDVIVNLVAQSIPPNISSHTLSEITITNIVDTIICGSIVSITERNLQDIQIFPNPATDKLFISLENEPGEKSIILYDINGRLIHQVSTSEQLIELNIPNLPSGVYYVTIYHENQMMISKKIFKFSE